ncbi:xanthine dehydrogenase molybdopterin binding subunit [Alginatibacterium sediminis]|uniref:Xanthine dehydrogenase molybdopterin binding subunit n=1 Tax=Alginatibacterium sediminis TaxID=2164068 RepID=A0A420EGT3_9ALTE|nr:xanthine dehydrogenase molybdopterin binding subunit [Alginatibacterium sediminis]RKF19888.1 xanthine dehydrogenase molybdopterin binding subunit [Alginatibacterium sediminis]
MRRLTQINHLDAQPSDIEFSVVGKSHKHESADKQVSGKALFVDDYPTPSNCLHAAVIVSNIAKGKIESTDFTQVESSSGVIKLITVDDIPGLNDIGPIFKGDPLLSDGTIKYHQQPIALVLARSHRQAWQAASKAKLTYQSETPNLSFEQAQQQPHLLPKNQFGASVDLDSLIESAVVVKGELEVGGQEHFYLEGQISLAQTTEDGGIFIRCSSQHPTEVQTLVAEVLDISFNKVTVDMRRMGGGFGGKESQAAQWACLASLGAHLTKGSVKLRLPRKIDMSATGKRHPFFNSYHIGANKHGVIEKAHIEVNGLCGHSADLSGAIVDRAMFHSDNAYSLGDASIVGNRLRTDTVSHTAFRGFGGPQGMITIERAIQDLSIKTGQDAYSLRLKNLYREGRSTTPYGMEVDQCDMLLEVMQNLEKSSDYTNRRAEIKQWNNSNLVLKKGLALSPVKFGIAFTATHLNQAGALVHVYTDGSVQVSHGGTEMGQGLHTKVAQIVAQTFGIPLDLVHVSSTRTDKVPNTSPTAASSGTDLNGMAAHNAAIAIKNRLLEFAKEHYNLDAEPIIVNGRFETKDQPVDWTHLVQQAYLKRISLSSSGFYKTPKIWFDIDKSVGRPFFYFSIGASCSEVTVDTLTGEMQVDRVDILHDVGNSLNPAIDIGQIEGAFIQGMGWVTNEELVWNKDGVLLSNSPMNYKIPSIGDYPKQMNITLMDKANPEHSIYRSKAVGEPPFMHAISLWCAIYDAVASISQHREIPNLQVPATGENILQACLAQFDAIGYTRDEAEVDNETIG